jgi:hypothetical protein
LDAESQDGASASDGALTSPPSQKLVPSREFVSITYAITGENLNKNYILLK